MDLRITTSKGEDFILEDVTQIKVPRGFILIVSRDGNQFDKIPRDRDIEIEVSRSSDEQQGSVSFTL